MLKSSVKESEAGGICHHDGGTTITGDAMMIFAAKNIQVGIKMHRKSGGRMRMTRAATITTLIAQAHKITEKGPYKKSPAEYERAEKDLQVWIDTLLAATPITDERSPPQV